MGKVTMAFYLAATRQGAAALPPLIVPSNQDNLPTGHAGNSSQETALAGSMRQPPQFDTNFKSLFSEEEMSLRSPDFPIPKKYLPVFDKSQRRFGSASNERPVPTSHPGMAIGGNRRNTYDLNTGPPMNEAMEGVDPMLYNQQAQGQTNQVGSPYAHSLHSAGSDGQYFDESFWENFNNDPGNAMWGAADNFGASAGLGFELGFGAGAIAPDGKSDNSQWPERGFEMLDGWLLGGTGTGTGAPNAGLGLGIDGTGSDGGMGGTG